MDVPVGENWAVETFLRLRPVLREDQDEVAYEIQDVVLNDGCSRSIVELNIPIDADPGLLHNNSSTGILRFEFDKIFNTLTSQEEIFDRVAKGKILDTLEGINCTIFAYGQTGSGKTFSMFGGETYQHRGIIPRTVSLIFNQLRDRKKNQRGFKFRCFLSFTEIYKEVIYDLLDENKKNVPLEQCTIVQLFEGENGIILKNLNVFDVTTEEDALRLFFLGNNNRVTTSTAMNNASSRSHAVFTLIIDTEGIKEDRTLYTSGKINLVDLAGSERMYKMANTKGMIKEAKAINLSLHYLEQVILCLREQAQQVKTIRHTNEIENNQSRKNHVTFIPYRNSVLTNLLRDSLGGNCRSSFLLTVNTEKIHFEESVATCRFGQRCGEVKVKVFNNMEVGLSDQLKDLTIRLKALEKQLQQSESQRLELQELLQKEQSMRRIQNDLRSLTFAEEQDCKDKVSDIIKQAKEFVTRKKSGGLVSLSSSIFEEEKRQMTSSFGQRFQRQIESLDKALLVDLCVMLAKSNQDAIVSAECKKLEEESREQIKIAGELEQREKQLQELRLLERLRASINAPIEDVLALPRLPAVIVAALTRGAVFVKYGRYGSKCSRYVWLSADLSRMIYRGIYPKEETSSAINLSAYDSVEHELLGVEQGRRIVGSLIYLKGSRNKPMTLEYADREIGADNPVAALEWAGALRYLVLKSKANSIS